MGGPASQGGVKTSGPEQRLRSRAPVLPAGGGPQQPGAARRGGERHEERVPRGDHRGTSLIALVAVGGTAYTVINENWAGLAAVWVGGFAVVAGIIVKSGYLEKDN